MSQLLRVRRPGGGHWEVLRTAGASASFDDDTESTTLIVQRIAASQSFTVTLGITDGCGEYQTWVGGGPN